MKDIITTLTEKLGQKLCNDKNILHDEIDEGMSINDFNKLMAKIKKSGVNLNNMSASQFIYTMYKALDPNDFHALGIQIDQAKKELKNAPISCGSMGGSTSCGYSPRRSSSSCGTSPGCGSERPARRRYSCGGNNDRC